MQIRKAVPNDWGKLRKVFLDIYENNNGIINNHSYDEEHVRFFFISSTVDRTMMSLVVADDDDVYGLMIASSAKTYYGHLQCMDLITWCTQPGYYKKLIKKYIEWGTKRKATIMLSDITQLGHRYRKLMEYQGFRYIGDNFMYIKENT